MGRKRIFSVALVLAMMVSLFAGITVNAASPITFTGAETVLFDYYFGDLTSVADAKDLDITGNWDFTKYFARCTDSRGYAKLTTKENYDFTNAAGFIYEVKMEVTDGKPTITLPGGYTVYYSSKTVYLAKGEEVLASKGIDLFDYDTVYTIKYLNGKWTVDVYINSDADKNISFEYTDTSNPELTGKISVSRGNTEKFTMYSMKLTRINDSTVVNNWKYEHTFNADDTVESLAKEGVTFNPAPVKFNASSVTIPSVGTVSFAPSQDGDKKMFTGDYVLRTKFYRAYGQGIVRFNVNNTSYYSISVTNDGGKVYLGKSGSVLDTKTFTTDPGGYQSFEVVVKVYNSDSSTRIVANVTNTKGGTLSFDYTDTDSPITYGNVAIVGQNWGTDSSISYIKINSLMSDSEMASETPVQYANTVIDKTFSSADTIDSLATEGITATGGTAVVDDTNGIYWDSAASSHNFVYTNDNALKGNYSFSSKFVRSYGNGTLSVYFSNDGTNYYVFSAANGSPFTLKKVYNGTTYTLWQSGSNASWYTSGCEASTINVSVTKQSEDSVKIKLSFDNSATQSVECVDSLTDVDVVNGADTGLPITEGTKITINQGYSIAHVYDFALKTYVDSWEEKVIDKTFSSADNATSLAKEGVTTGGGTASYDDTNGIYWTTNSSQNEFTYTNDTALKGSYSFSSTHSQNEGGDLTLRFSKDGSNYYQFRAVSGSPYTLSKVYNGTTYTLWQSTSNATNGQIRYGTTTLKVSVTQQDDESVKIDFYYYNTFEKKTVEFDCTDNSTDKDVSGLDTGAPITTGTQVCARYGYAKAKVNSFALTKQNTSKWYDTNGEPMYIGRFFDGAGNGLSKLQNGAVYFDYPVARLGSYKVIATLHENNEMTDIKVLDPIDLYAGKARLFTVTDADNAIAKVFFFDSEEGLNKLTEVYELN